ncbi:MAG: tryptophan--tRNA ligase [Bdellovibrionales bacterium CG10_big_fil_rev_8_21_14_0_10_45_34]|nr:MAG: tryptophan--tRNA ligase [Bdellovibrionales bacterium CG10_big_fil_rev_8_21_14_0_10_45_34]
MTEQKSEKKPAMKRVMSGMRTTGSLHIGNYFGSLINYVKLQNEGYECFFGAMDWHALTTSYRDSESVGNYTRDIIADWLAWGVDPEKSVVYIQSKLPELLELTMVFANLTPMGWLERVTTWKDAIEEMKSTDTHNLGRFMYPVLQAADIAIFNGEAVPVGKDQVPHLELSRDIIQRFNRIYGVTLKEPQPLLTENPLVPGTDGRKMSKSYGNIIPLTEEAKSSEKRIKKMQTDPARVRREDPGEPTKCPVYYIHKLYSSDDDLAWVEKGCRSAGIGCGDCKGRLIENREKVMSGPRQRKNELLNNKQELDSILSRGCDRARAEAAKTMASVRKAMKWSGGSFS